MKRERKMHCGPGTSIVTPLFCSQPGPMGSLHTCLLTAARLVSKAIWHQYRQEKSIVSLYSWEEVATCSSKKTFSFFSYHNNFASDYSTASGLLVSRNRLGLPPFCRSNGGIFLCKLPISGFVDEVKRMHFMHLMHFMYFMQLWIGRICWIFKLIWGAGTFLCTPTTNWISK
jgi:hypothetical protein